MTHRCRARGTQDGGGPGRLRAAVALLAALAVVPACGALPGSDDGAGSSELTEERAGAETAPDQERGGDQSGESGEINVTDLGINTGSPTAPIRVIEFSDFGCPHCRSFHMETYPTIREEYVETGKVVWKYVPFVLGTFPNSLDATRAGHCAAEQQAFGAVRDRIFRMQQEWMRTEEPRSLFLEYAREEGLDVDSFRSCLEEARPDAQIQEALTAGRRIGIRGTPTFFIQGEHVQGNYPAEFFREVFDDLLEEEGAGQNAAGPRVDGPS